MDEQTAYHDDFYGWSQDQAEVLRSMRDRPGLPNGLDLEHIIEEIEGVGSSQLSAVESFLRLIFLHLIKAASSNNPEVKGYWREEILGFHADFLARYSPSMRRVLDLNVPWRRALRQAKAALEDHGEAVQAGLPQTCPLLLDELLSDELDLGILLERINQQASGD